MEEIPQGEFIKEDVLHLSLYWVLKDPAPF